MIRGTVEGKGEVVLASRRAVDQALHEMGATRPIDIGSKELDATYLDSVVAMAQRLLGDSFEQLRRRHERGKNSTTPPRSPHRLMELIDAAQAAATTFRTGNPTIDPVATVELDVTLGLLDRWRHNPEWPSLRQALGHPQDYPHVLVTLAAASFLADAGNAVQFVPVAAERRPDLRVHVGARTVIGAEIKAPVVLRRPEVPIAEQADTIMRKALKKAGSGITGQLSASTDAILVVGGVCLRDADLDALEVSASRVLSAHAENRGHLMAIAILSLGVLIDIRTVGPGQTMPALNATLGVRVFENPSYAGVNKLSQEPRPGLRPIKEPVREIILAGSSEQPRPGRNDPCWCGSGKKYKRCHGA